LSDTESDDDEEEEEEQQGHAANREETLEEYRSRQRPRRSARFTATTHRQGRARIDSDDDDNGARTATEGTRATGGDDIDWENIQDEE
jgi:hypothetical protein